MTTTERKALAASLTPEEREKFSTACDSHFLDAIAAHGTIGDDVAYWDVIDAALIEATKDRPTMPELGPYNGDGWCLYGNGEAHANDADDQSYAPHGAQLPTKQAAEAEARYTRAWRRLRQITAKLSVGKVYPATPDRNAWTWYEIAHNGPNVCVARVTDHIFRAGRVRFATEADASAAHAQLITEGINPMDLFPEGC